MGRPKSSTKHMDPLTSEECVSGSGSGVWSGMGAPCGEMVTAKSPRPAMYAPDPPRIPTLTPSPAINMYNSQTTYSSRKSQSCSDTPLYTHTHQGLLWTGQDPGLTQLPHHTTPPPCPGSRKEKALEDLRLSSLRAWPHREREGGGLPRPGLRTWGEGWLKPKDPASRASHSQVNLWQG